VQNKQLCGPSIYEVTYGVLHVLLGVIAFTIYSSHPQLLGTCWCRWNCHIWWNSDERWECEH